MRSFCIFAILAAMCLGSWTKVRADTTKRQPTANEIRFFETRIRPLLVNRCFKCHGPKRQRGDLRLDSAEAMRKGGVSGESVIVPGHPEKSLLIKAVLRKHKIKMPPNDKLKDREIADLTNWVRIGAPVPINVAATDRDKSKHWAFAPPIDPTLPQVRDRNWPRSPLDRFILAELEAKGLHPSSQADRRTLIRRATFDLIGLPPTPDEVNEFLTESRANPQAAFAKVVDRLLSSPHYGERWGRHWLDVARYADSNGLDENVAFGNAWRYRDYVVAAFNTDKPYDQFLLEQLAGDLLPPPPMQNGNSAAVSAVRRERLIATGFLALGPKVLAEVDEKKMEMDILDEQIDTIGRSLMGLTLGCARCHNHKFDPISMEDYYGLAGIFQSTKTMENFKKVARWHENSIANQDELAQKALHDKRIVAQKSAIKILIRNANERLKAGAKSGTRLPKNPEKTYPKETKAKLKKLRDELARSEKSAPVLPSAMGVTEGRVENAKILRRGNHLTPGKVAIRRFPVVLAGAKQTRIAPTQSGRLELARWLIRKDHPLTSRVMVNRIWRWHFGQGLVRSTDDFGKRGERPSHPELLDWLAHRFMENGWSIKKMHRMIVLSATYQQTSEVRGQGKAHRRRSVGKTVDPDNRLLWRMNIRRLEAEAIRDALLAVSGTLDRKQGGSLLHVKNRKYFFDHTSKDQTRYDSPRRSIYLPVVRNNLYDVFQLFDATDGAVSNGNRATTTVATQALFMMNGKLVAKTTENLASSLLAMKQLNDDDRLRLLYLKAYSRPPTAREITRGRAAIADFERALRERESDVVQLRLRAWTLLCHVIVAANEFVYVN